MLHLFNTLTGIKEKFEPIDQKEVKLYVCGPTVYSRPHIGNMRSVVVYDVLYRILKHIYPNVKYVRNITDVDDKIINIATTNNKSINEITRTVETQFIEDCNYLNCLPPTLEPRATQELPAMIEMIQRLIKNGHAYTTEGNVLFSVNSFADYGKLSNQIEKQLLSGTREVIESAKDKKEDFILWKTTQDNGFESPFGYGRPGWHLECAAMSTKYLGENFDIHGGGADLQFPHHENEIAQSCCANPGSTFAKYWVHNGFLNLNSEKMSKSLNNIVTVEDLKNRGLHADVIRLALLSTSYRKPLDFNDSLIENSDTSIKKFHHILKVGEIKEELGEIPEFAIGRLLDDLNIQVYMAKMFAVFKDLRATKDAPNQDKLRATLYKMGQLIGLFYNFNSGSDSDIKIPAEIKTLVNERNTYKQKRDFENADLVKQKIIDLGYTVMDSKDGTIVKPIK